MIKPLTSLRFIFALMVFFHHLSASVHGHSALLYSLFYEGFIGVSFFFILSGFILTYTYKDKLLKKQITKKEFWIARLAKIYPLHLLTMLVAIPPSIYFVTELPKWANFLFQITLTQSFVPITSTFYSYNAVAWSISNEAFFYFVFPFLIPVLFSRKRALPIALLSMMLVPLVSLFVTESSAEWILKINPVFRLADFVIGIVLYELYEKYGNKLSARSCSILEVAAVFLLVLFIAVSQVAPLPFRFSFYYWLPMSLLIFAFAFQKGWLSKLLSFRAMIVLGEISFAFYMIHQQVIKYADYGAKKFAPAIYENKPVLFSLLFGLSLSASFVLHYFAEKPLNSWVRSRFSPKTNRRNPDTRISRSPAEKSLSLLLTPQKEGAQH